MQFLSVPRYALQDINATSCSIFSCFDTLGLAQAAPGERIAKHKGVHELLHTNR